MNSEFIVRLLKWTFVTLGTIVFGMPLEAQMPSQTGATMFGNEWISYDQIYLRIPVGSDGWYVMNYEELISNGLGAEDLISNSLIMYHNGEQIPLQVSTDGLFSSSDQIAFYGRKNRTDLEEFLFYDPERQILNSQYSLFTDTSIYFLTIEPDTEPIRYRNAGHNMEVEKGSAVWKNEKKVYSDQFYTQAPQGIINPDFNDLEGFATPFATEITREVEVESEKWTGDSIYLDIGAATDLNTRSYSLFINDENYKEISGELVQSAHHVRVALPAEKVGKKISIKLQCKESTERVALTYIDVLFQASTSDLELSDTDVFWVRTEGLNHRIEFIGESPYPRLYNLSQNLVFEPQSTEAGAVYNLTGNKNDEYSFFNIKDSIQGIRSVTFSDYLSGDFDYLIVTSEYLRKEPLSEDEIAAYANYRGSDEGGGFRVKIVSIEQLQDQYIYGVQGHPYAVRNFIGKLIAEERGVRFVNIIGKGMGYGYLRAPKDYKNRYYKSHFVPTYGHYGSDNLLVAQKGTAVPRIPVGRIPATTPEEIGHYLEKVKTYESVLRNPEMEEDRVWMKRVMHFNGGDRNIFSIISNFMDDMGENIQRDTFAAQLISYYKSSFGSSDVPEREEIFSYINNGAALISFFGHSASSSLDFNIDIIGEYDNKGRLPIFLALGCSSGNIFLPNKNLAERFILTPDIGSVLFLSTATSEYLSNLQNFARSFYGEFGSQEYGQPMGEVVQAALLKLGAFQKHLQAVFVFAGDPAIASYHFEGPDFTFDTKSVLLNPARPSLVDESFTLEVDIQNIGVRNTDTFPVLVEQVLPNGDRSILDTVWTSIPGFDTTLTLTLPVRDEMEGKNIIHLTIDPDHNIEEYPSGVSKLNNQFERNGMRGVEVYIQNTTLQLTYPYDQSIIPISQPVLELFNGNVLNHPVEYVIELDTTPNFTSGQKITLHKSSSKAKVDIAMDIPLSDANVYYWKARLKTDSIYTPSASFIYLPDRTGWNQSHYGQFRRDSLVNLEVPMGKLDFAQIQNVYKLDHGYKKAAIIFNEIHRPRFFRTTYPALNVSIFKPRKNTWVNNPKPGLYHSIWPVSADPYLFTFVYRPYDAVQRTAIVELIEKEAEEGDYVIFWNTTNGRNSPKGETWALDSINQQGVNLFNYFEREGASQIRRLSEEDRRAYSLIYKKGQGIVTEILGDSAGVNTDYVNLYSYFAEGQMWSKSIGFLKSLESYEAEAFMSGSDTMNLVLSTTNKEYNIDFDNQSNSIQHGVLESTESDGVFSWYGNIKDTEDRTLPSFYWRVFGAFLPDWIISNSEGVPLIDTTAFAQNKLVVQFEIDQRGNPVEDSVSVLLELFNGFRTLEHRMKIPADQVRQTIRHEWPLGSEYIGAAVVKVTVDPDNEVREAQELNNFIITNFEIGGDRIAPKVDVLFDQQRILNRDIIAPDAQISILVSDFPNNNISSNSEFAFKIKKPSGAVLNIDLEDQQLRIDSTGKGFEIVYQADFNENGFYELTVNVRDRFGNVQAEDVHIEFEVVLENKVSSILPYPNPFVDAVRFAYTLTGRDEPEVFRILIYTVSGRLVKEITKSEFGPLRTGRHLSDLVWDGTDNWNQKLAPGVYLYKVIARDSSGEAYEEYQIGELEQGNYFKNGIGKMVKLR